MIQKLIQKLSNDPEIIKKHVIYNIYWKNVKVKSIKIKFSGSKFSGTKEKQIKMQPTKQFHSF